MPNSLVVFCLLIVAVLAPLLYGLFQAKVKGIIGEKTVASILYLLDKYQYKVINNVVLNTDGKTSQINHVIVSDFGIFVVETKNYKGWIMGGENAEYWTQVLYHRKEKLYNPIRQNLGHIAALKKSLGEFSNIKYISIIVFSSRATIKVKTDTAIIRPIKLLGVIGKYKEPNLSESEKVNIFNKINALNFSDKYNKSEHIKSIHQRIQKRENSISEKICPYCGGGLILRQRKFGPFLGCSSFPRCKFISKA